MQLLRDNLVRPRPDPLPPEAHSLTNTHQTLWTSSEAEPSGDQAAAPAEGAADTTKAPEASTTEEPKADA